MKIRFQLYQQTITLNNSNKQKHKQFLVINQYKSRRKFYNLNLLNNRSVKPIQQVEEEMRQNLMIKKLDTLSFQGDTYDNMTPYSKLYLKNEDELLIKAQEIEYNEEGALFDSQHQMVKELNFVPYFKIDSTLRFNTQNIEEQTREKKITWQDLSKNILDTQGLSILSPVNDERKLSTSFMNKSALKKLNLSQSLSGSVISKQQYINKYFKDSFRVAQAAAIAAAGKHNSKSKTSSARDVLNSCAEENTDNLSTEKNTKAPSFRRKSLSNNFVYFSNDMEQNLRQKNQFWIFSDVEENLQNEINSNNFPQSTDSQKRNNKTTTKTYAQRRMNQNRGNTYINSGFTPKNQAKKETKIIDNIKMRPKSCCCNRCGPELNKNKKLISLPFKTAIQNAVENSKLGINTGLKCIAFIGKVRRSKYIDSLMFNQLNSLQNNLENPQILQPENTEVANQQTNKQKKNSYSLHNPLYLSLQNYNNNNNNNGSNRKPSHLSLNENGQANQKRLSYVSKDQEDLSNSEKKERSSILKVSNLEIINVDQNNQKKDQKLIEDQQFQDQSQIVKQFTFQTQSSQSDFESQQNSQEDYSELSQQKINFRQSQLFSTQKSLNKIVNKKQKVQQIISMHKQASRVGQITKLALKNENSEGKDGDYQSCKKAEQNQNEQIQTDRVAYHISSTSKQERNNYKTHTNSIFEDRISQRIISNTKLQPISKINIENQYKMQDRSASFKQGSFNNNQNAGKALTQNECYYSQQLQISNKQLHQMVYLPLRSFKQNESLTDRTSQQKLKNSIRVQTLIQNEKEMGNLTEDIKSFESIHTQFLNTTSDSFKEPKLIQFKRRILDKEEQKLVSMSQRSDYKIYLQQQDSERQHTFAPKLTTSKDFLSRFVQQKKNQNSLYFSKQYQNKKFNKLNKAQIIDLNDEKSQLKIYQNIDHKIINVNRSDDRQKYFLQKRENEQQQQNYINNDFLQKKQNLDSTPSSYSQNLKSS
ncbi:hypothetical protein TTHERM_00485850 (macronuclear) [Tetrahymena thermophila SB210]|uniref:Uncharacterized protein n=1 Tax=Tetrahymena thermophila (strain SB210) TaxID=312017 RepID=I7MGG3_TETTS|nr:hypothetical protein TTHERM_00485850 [Tetrahymena thermophila SB210]EAR85135.2 hypothetical protein TTHERM_00485850 [Tetrahymena thermophila SB210]|eukprot:XP_001032798.2 hypothetical protein TTHERM_00485850 [Tetrahymena thermophila SB210]